ncbi:MAG: DUF6273 domain-containing protein [Oscillospiraceae bacterium]|nr:DUF6273 domain-containing protein [Oscillospiraceae bacterium]
MTEKSKTAWKAIGAIVSVIFVALSAFGCGFADHPEAPEAGKPTEELAVGNTTHFGQYDWRVLDVQGNLALLLSEDIIETLPYNAALKDVTWEDCTLRIYLNGAFGAFYESFSEAERARIALTHNENPDNTWGTMDGERFNTPGGNATDDRIFLLSVPEVLKYFPGLKLHKDSDGNEWYYEADKQLVAKPNNGTAWWWLRSPGFTQDSAASVDSDGRFGLTGLPVNYGGGVRPALWIKL